MSITQRKPEEAWKLLSDYEDLNSDLPKQTAKQLGAFAIAHRVGKSALEEIFNIPSAKPYFKHTSWRWWNCLQTSGLADYWNTLIELRHGDGKSLKDICIDLREKAPYEKWRKFSERMGTPLKPPEDEYCLNPHRQSRAEAPFQLYWTKGGCWAERSNFTKIIVHGEELPYRPAFKTFSRLRGDKTRKLERELYNLINPDKELEPRAKRHAVQYTRRRIPELMGWPKEKHAAYDTVSWFFDEWIPKEETNYWYHWKHERPHKGTKGRYSPWVW